MMSLDGKVGQHEQLRHHHSSHCVQERVNFPFDFHHASGQVNSTSRGWGPQLNVSAGTAANGQKLPSSYDNSADVELPFHRSPSVHSGSLNVETSMLEKNLELRPFSPPSAPALWPAVLESHPLSSVPVPPNQKQFRSSVSLIESNKPINVGINSSVFLPPQQFEFADRKTPISSMMLPLSHQPIGLMHGNRPSHEQGDSMRSQPQEPHGGYIPSVPPHLSSHLFAQSLDHVQMQGQEVAGGSLSSQISAMPSLGEIQSMLANSTHVHAGIMPPLPPGPPPASAHMGSLSQNSGSVMSKSPVTAFPGLISTLMAQGLISLTPPARTEVSVCNLMPKFLIFRLLFLLYFCWMGK